MVCADCASEGLPHSRASDRGQFALLLIQLMPEMIGLTNCGCPFSTLSSSSVCAGDMPISLEHWRAAVGRWVARIQRTLIIRRGVKRSPPCASNQEWESSLGQSHRGGRKFVWKRKGRKKHKDDPVNDPAIASDEFYDGVIVLAATLFCFGMTLSKDCSDRNPACSLTELFGWTGLGAFLVIMLLLLRSGDVEPNPGPAERGG